MASLSNHLDQSPDAALVSQIKSQGTSKSEPPASDSKKERSQLRSDFQPSNYSVICGRVQGKASCNHVGNRRLRIIAGMSIESYSQTSRKTAKTAIVSRIIAVIRQAGGHFCEYKRGTWFEVGDIFAREKVGTLMRDLLHSQYRSSNKSKTAIRRARKQSQDEQPGQKLVDGTENSDDSSTTSSCGESNKDFLELEHSPKNDLFDMNSDDSSTTSSSWGISKDSPGVEHSLDDTPSNIFDIDVFQN
jgi:hypothetical protein